ncbi:MAG: DNA mismatch repair endonuclease MutL, partial [Bacilli bacterium]|nr:DNA mismatch repair endonuclease MutL [Bacilli bacterium]
MSKIRVMDELLANKIAAGEVVERIVSIVKELVENSIDADSSEIIIELKESGLREIKITDNGIGMDRDDAHNAFLRHATSKLYDEDDLFNINSLGFRGEALPSIASVSSLELRTCYKDEEVGTFIHIKGGKIINEEDIASRVGTTFKISNLFYNTPARLKHLASSYSELSNVIEYINKIALSYPDIRFKLINDDKEIFSTNGTGNILKVINSIYGLEVTKKMIQIDNSNDDYKISGYISMPEVSRANKSHMTTLVNGRVVKNSMLYRTISDSYSNFKEDSKYPVCVIYIECDPSLLDVNIHPSKLDIKFSNFDELNNLIKETIITSLKDKLLIPNIKLSNNKSDIKYENLSLDISRLNNNIVKEDNSEYKNKLEDFINFRNDNDIIDKITLSDEEERISDIVSVSSNKKIPELYPVGLLLGTYIVCENELGIYLIDQHAAKERINYEKISYKLSHPTKDTISSLVPIVIELPKNEYLIIKENMDILDNLNIKVEEFGVSSLRVVSHPIWFTYGKEEDIMRGIIELILNKEKNFKVEKFNDNLAKMISCKMSIKANTYIDKASMESLINDLRECDNPYNCPHGRPAIIHFSIYELEKMFKRSI